MYVSECVLPYLEAVISPAYIQELHPGHTHPLCVQFWPGEILLK